MMDRLTSFRKYIISQIKYPIKVLAYDLLEEDCQEVYTDYSITNFKGLSYTRFSRYNLFDFYSTNSWLALFTVLMTKPQKNIVCILEDIVWGDAYYNDIPIRIKHEALNLSNIQIPQIDNHEKFLKLAMWEFICKESGYKITKILIGEHNIAGGNIWAAWLELK